jgi:undecaprenyl diphosphate synthase
MNMNIPRHVVIVPDGNRRWAKKKGQPPFFGHRAGGKAAEDIIKEADKAQIECLTLWGCSVNNLTGRSTIEVKFLYRVFEQLFKKLEKQFKTLEKKKVRVQVLGRWRDFFPPSLKKVAERIIEKTKKFESRTLTLLMAYDGREEMVSAIQGIVRKEISPAEVDSSVIKKHLWSHNLPPVDLVIRTGGEPHWSAGLMMWDVAEARLYFTKTLWPDFSPKELRKALKAYAGQERRYGR